LKKSYLDLEFIIDLRLSLVDIPITHEGMDIIAIMSGIAF